MGVEGVEALWESVLTFQEDAAWVAEGAPVGGDRQERVSVPCVEPGKPSPVPPLLVDEVDRRVVAEVTRAGLEVFPHAYPVVCEPEWSSAQAKAFGLEAFVLPQLAREDPDGVPGFMVWPRVMVGGVSAQHLVTVPIPGVVWSSAGTFLHDWQIEFPLIEVAYTVGEACTWTVVASKARQAVAETLAGDFEPQARDRVCGLCRDKLGLGSIWISSEAVVSAVTGLCADCSGSLVRWPPLPALPAKQQF